ncbi:hypothetical protein AB0C69_10910 [Actinomadura sp. NPDC048032]|uniref:hypothetical protein n=1 Tax=Actinomadura sp. NPDC048032 TaxID=3155747 RepID=UPI0033FD7A12
MPKVIPALTLEELLELPVSVDLVTAGKAFGMGRTKSSELARKGEFPCRVLRLGNSYRVPRIEIFRALGMHDTPEHTLGLAAESA